MRLHAPFASCALILIEVACGSTATGPSGFGAPSTDADGGIPEAGQIASDSGVGVASDSSVAFVSGDGASASSGCEPGKYSGQYTGTFQTVIPTTGPVTITLTPSTQQNGEFTLVTNGGTWDTTWGPMAGDASLPVEMGHATLVGQLDCTNDQFTAVGTNTYFTILGLDSGSFTLNLQGTYDPATQSISGTFAYVSNDGSGNGTWQVSLTP